jgi:4-amino-4-deoxy-L-arabinose transferase-like glycosyltransferase
MKINSNFFKRKAAIILACFFSVFSLFWHVWDRPSATGLSIFEWQTVESAHNIYASNMSNLPYLYLVKISVKIFGLNPLAVRLPSILLGMATLVLFWLAIRSIVDKKIASPTIILLSTSTWFLSFARTASPAISYAFFIIGIVYFAKKIIDQRSDWLNYAMLGLFVGVSQYSPGMIYLTIPMIGIGVYILQRNHWRLSSKGTVLGAVTMFLPISVLAVGLFNNPEQIKNILLLPTSFPGPSTVFANLMDIISSVLWQSELPWAFGIPSIGLLTFAEIALGILGGLTILYALPSVRSVLFVWFSVLILFVLSVLATPEYLIILALVGSYFAIAIGIEVLWERWRTIFPKNPAARMLGGMIVLILLSSIALLHNHQYFGGWTRLPQVKDQFIDYKTYKSQTKSDINL